MYVLDVKWKLGRMLCLVQSPKRFNEIQKEIKCISPNSVIDIDDMAGILVNLFSKSLTI